MDYPCAPVDGNFPPRHPMVPLDFRKKNCDPGSEPYALSSHKRPSLVDLRSVRCTVPFMALVTRSGVGSCPGHNRLPKPRTLSIFSPTSRTLVPPPGARHPPPALLV